MKGSHVIVYRMYDEEDRLLTGRMTMSAIPISPQWFYRVTRIEIEHVSSYEEAEQVIEAYSGAMLYPPSRADRIGQRIRRFRRAKGFSREEFAAHVNVSVDTVVAWELGKSAPRADRVSTIAQVLDCDPEEIVTAVSPA